jgi:hypothetical protein
MKTYERDSDGETIFFVDSPSISSADSVNRSRRSGDRVAASVVLTLVEQGSRSREGLRSEERGEESDRCEREHGESR